MQRNALLLDYRLGILQLYQCNTSNSSQLRCTAVQLDFAMQNTAMQRNALQSNEMHCNALLFDLIECTLHLKLKCSASQSVTVHPNLAHYTALHLDQAHPIVDTLHCSAPQFSAIHYPAPVSSALHLKVLHFSSLHLNPSCS